MTQTQALKQIRRKHWRALANFVKRAYREGYEAGWTRASRGQARRGRTVREDATIEGLVRLIEAHFGLDRYGFEVRIVHGGSARRVAGSSQLRSYRLAD